MSRRKSRIIAFQAIYSWDVSGESLDNLTQFSWVDSKENLDESELTFSRLLIAGTIENIKGNRSDYGRSGYYLFRQQ